MKLRLRGMVAWGFFASCARAMWQCNQRRFKMVIFAVRAVARFYAANAG
nr:hypothetical protein [uncultured Campylobacter sp.]